MAPRVSALQSLLQLLQQHPAALLVDVQAGLDGIYGGLFLEDAAHIIE